MIRIPLNKGYSALIDDEDADLSCYRWFCCNMRWGPYANREKPMVKGVRGKKVMLHREIAERMGLDLSAPKMVVDHINGNPLDCRRENLRLLTCQENNRNTNASKPHRKGGTVGVIWCKAREKWQAYITVSGKIKNLGRFDALEDAVAARLAGEATYFGDVKPRRAG